jgi:anti-anti-sigma factor
MLRWFRGVSLPVLDHAYDDSTSTLAIAGEIDEACIAQLRDRVQEVTVGHTRSVTVDLTEVTLLPSAAIGVLAAARRDAARNDQRLALVAAPGTIAEAVLRVIGMLREQD